MRKENFTPHHFKEYAAFCLHNGLEEVSTSYVDLLRQSDAPLLTLLFNVKEQEFNAWFKNRMKLFLESAVNNCALSELESITKDWVKNKLPWHIDKYSIQPIDILLGCAARKNALLSFLPSFTMEVRQAMLISAELNVFNMLIEEKIFKAYLDIQQEIVRRKNRELNRTNKQLQKHILERINAERRLRKEKGLNEALINNSVDGIVAFDKKMKITAWNRTLELQNGLSKEEVIGKNIFEIFPAYKDTEQSKAIHEVLSGKKIYLGDKPYLDRRGFYEAYLVPLLNEKNSITGALTIIHDITERKLAEDKIRQREAQLKEVQEIAHLGSWEWNIHRNRFSWSDEMFRIFGYDPGEIEITYEEFLNHISEPGREELIEKIESSLVTQEPFVLESRIRQKDGNERCIYGRGKVLTMYNVPYKIVGIALDITYRKEAEEALSQKNQALVEKNEELQRAEEALKTINNALEQRVDERTRQLIQINEDLQREISEKKKAENALRQRNEELVRINADLDNFVYTASHDLKAPISNIEGLVHVLNQDTGMLPESLREIIGLINDSIVRFKGTIHDLSEITKIQKNLEEDIITVDLQELMEEIRISIKDMIDVSGARITTDFCRYPSLRFSKANLKSILYNLLSNAIKYRAPGRAPEISIWCEPREEFVVINVSDNGLGIDAGHKHKIFTMFKRLHDHVEGSGVGLYLVKRIIDNAGGRIEVESRVDEGSTFRVYLRSA